MVIKSAEFIVSNSDYKKCPSPVLPEYAFIGRSNVGKSSLINMLVNFKNLAKVSTKPGKTQLINHFLINKDWYLVDLPGYGYAKTSKEARNIWAGFLKDYLNKRSNLICIFILIDSRLNPQKSDLEFMYNLAINHLPFAMIFTKADKLTKNQLSGKIKDYLKKMEDIWETLPVHFVSSSHTKKGRDEILNYIEELNKSEASVSVREKK